MRCLDVGVVGCGTAGPAAALFLAEQGHRVTVYERVEAPRPVGAGIILQPTGQAVLDRLGLREAVVARGERLDGLRVETASGARLLSLSYADVSATVFGVGLHRGVLFEALYGALREAPVSIRLGVGCESLEKATDGRLAIVDDRGARHGPHDLLVVADGARSRLRDDGGLARRADPYPWGALWFVAEDPDHVFQSELLQIVDGTRRMMGLLPTGRGPTGGSSATNVSLFYSLPAASLPAFRARGLAAFQDEIVALEPRAAFVLEQIASIEEVLFSAYHDVVMSPWHSRRVVYLGDAAHAMSPQLGQGANLALWDAMVLADALREHDALTPALDAYSRRRRAHLGYYQFVTRWLTPFFQSDLDALGVLRDALMPLANRVGAFNRAMVMGMCGTADGHPWKELPLPEAK